MSNNVRYAIIHPKQTRLGGWLCSVVSEDQQEIYFETFQPTQRMAFTECALWVMGKNELNKTAIPEEPKVLEEKKEEPNTNGQTQQT